MSRESSSKRAITVDDIRKRKASGTKVSMVTCYDSAFARLIERSSIDIVLVGDSLGNVMLGFDNTIPVTVDHMIHHSAAVARVLKKPLLVVDMPFFSYNISVEQSLTNAARLIQEGGAHAVKVEGGHSITKQVRALTSSGIPVMGHLGLTPQQIHTLGGYKVQGRSAEARQVMIDEAKALEDAGAFSIVLELIPADLAEAITTAVHVPVIGIGAGPKCDGQVLVIHDLLGFDEGFEPKFLKKYARLGNVIVDAISRYDQEVKEGLFPSNDQSF